MVILTKIRILILIEYWIRIMYWFKCLKIVKEYLVRNKLTTLDFDKLSFVYHRSTVTGYSLRTEHNSNGQIVEPAVIEMIACIRVIMVQSVLKRIKWTSNKTDNQQACSSITKLNFFITFPLIRSFTVCINLWMQTTSFPLVG